MLYMLDTNSVSDIARGRSAKARERLNRVTLSEPCISAITWGETCFGLEKRPLAIVVRTAVLDLVESLVIMPWGVREGDAYGALRAAVERVGTPIGNLDLLIAAHALTLGATLVTRDKAFRRIPGLQLENWATDLQ